MLQDEGRPILWQFTPLSVETYNVQGDRARLWHKACTIQTSSIILSYFRTHHEVLPQRRWLDLKTLRHLLSSSVCLTVRSDVTGWHLRWTVPSMTRYFLLRRMSVLIIDESRKSWPGYIEIRLQRTHWGNWLRQGKRWKIMRKYCIWKLIQ